MRVTIATILSEGEKLEDTVAVLSIEVRKELDRIPEAKLVILDGDGAARTFNVSNRGFFAPGKKITIKLRQGDGRDAPVFTGVVVRHAVEAHEQGTELRVELKDVAVALTRGRRSMALLDVKDDEVYDKIAQRGGLKVGKLGATKVKHRQLVQYNATDWDFLLSRADINGHVVLVDDGTLSVRSPADVANSVLTIDWGLEIVHSFELELDVTEQYSGVKGLAWDPAQQAASSAQAKPTSGGPIKRNASALAKSLPGDPYSLVLPGAALADELGAWADARLARSRLSLMRGRVVIPGKPAVKPLDHVELIGVGKRFEGKALVSGVVHRVDPEGWSTELTLGLSPDWFARKPDIADVPAGGLLPPATTLQIGVIVALEADPQGEYRVQLELPALGDANNQVWARLARPDAGKQRGFLFWPEIGDEVVVGFFAGDPRQAVVLGALHSSALPPPAEPKDDNDTRALVSRAGTSITFDDKKKSVTIKTPKGSTIVIDDDAGTIQIADANDNAITLGSSGVKIASAKDIELDASNGKVVIKGTAVDIQ